MPFPPELKDPIIEAATRLGESIAFLGWPSGPSSNAPPPEGNALFCLQHAMLQHDPDYHFYTEGRIGKGGRIDLIASNATTSLAIEAKSFGKIHDQSLSVMEDLTRLQDDFKPAYYRGVDGARKVRDWWKGSQQRWGLVIITSFRGREVMEAWMTDHESEALALMASYKKSSDRTAAGEGFIALRSTPKLCRFAAPIPLGPEWSDTGAGYLLCGAIPLGVDASSLEDCNQQATSRISTFET